MHLLVGREASSKAAFHENHRNNTDVADEVKNNHEKTKNNLTRSENDKKKDQMQPFVSGFIDTGFANLRFLHGR
jgi:hypothetical protein